MKYKQRQNFTHNPELALIEILESRGVKDIHKFLSPSFACEYNPYDLENIEIAAEMECEGHSPTKPQLRYLQRDPNIQTLITLRMDEEAPISHQKYMLKMSNSSGIKVNDAVNIDAFLKGLKYAGNTSVESEARNELRRYLEYEIYF